MTDFKDKGKAEFENVLCVAESTLAICVRGVLDDPEEEIWLPKSQVDDDSEVWKRGDEGRLVISQWIAEQKGLV